MWLFARTTKATRSVGFPHYCNKPAHDSSAVGALPRTNGGCGSPFVTTTDGSSNLIVWVMGTVAGASEGDQRLHGYDGETGAVVYAGGGPNELIPGTHTYSTTGIVARGRIYIAGDNKVYAFAVPVYSYPVRLPQPRPET